MAKNKGGRPRSIDPGAQAPMLSFRISDDDLEELLAAIDAENLKLSQLVRMIVHGWAEERRRRSGAAGVPGRRRPAAAR